ncbi:MAG: prephenate dehydrogenase/arogenate dehydrogenase family protein, partial [Alphaproteobacteria bacterium]|nr:prephenate dehydrogenase/arogenate dehydrogenase family protein [Alphaproteobacteria bacterium]
MAQPPLFDRVALIGLGLIGGSLGRVIRREGLAREIVGAARTAPTRAKALEIGLVDRVEDDPADAVDGADLVVLCTPVGAYVEMVKGFAPRHAPGAIVTHVGSVKEAVIRDIGPF